VRVAFDSLLRHARLFGTECVYETAGRMSDADRLRLRIELDAIDRKRKRGRSRRHTGGKAEATRSAVLLLAADGLMPKAIANKLHVSDRTVRRYLDGGREQAGQQPKSASQTRTVERRSWPKTRNAGNDMSEGAA
jgi:hypothetical protein